MLKALMLTTALAMCGGNSSPTISGSAVYREDIVPNGVRWGVWGASGYVEAEVACRSLLFTNYEVANSGVIYFAGGGNSYTAAMQLTVTCSWLYPYIIRGTEGAWSWD